MIPHQILRERLLACAALMLAMTTGAASADNWDEGVNGDLSGHHSLPTVINLSLGSNLLIGSVGALDDDFFLYTVPVGWTLDQVIVVNYDPPGSTMFLGVNRGPIYGYTANVNVYGWVFFGTPAIGTDLLPSMAASNGRFTPPLTANTYTWWLDGGPGTESYSLEFRVVPAPGVATVLAIGVLVGLRRRR